MFMKILITGIGCIGKSSLREKLALAFPNKVITVDMDYNKEVPVEADKVVIVESVHGLEENSQNFDRILYLLPPRYHIFIWFRRAWAWFSTGVVDLSAPKGKRKRFALSNILIILKIVHRNILNRRKWIKADIKMIQKYFFDKTFIAKSSEQGYRVIKNWVKYYVESQSSRAKNIGRYVNG